MKAGYGIRRTDRDFELASVSREVIEKFSKRTKIIEQLAREKYTVLEAQARALAKVTGIEFADALAEVKSRLGAESRESKSATTLSAEEQRWKRSVLPFRPTWRWNYARGEMWKRALRNCAGALADDAFSLIVI
ncbi:MAG: relaxase domain-containing protein [Verrucomicrobia bacterium]|nr:relaxase domain-containing protein [Verrucomicrobiota bacterium]